MNTPCLSSEYILSVGINFDLLSYDADMKRVLDDFEACGGRPFSGLTYELTRTKKIAWYGWYANGLPNGERVEFTPEGTIKKRYMLKDGKSVEPTHNEL